MPFLWNRVPSLHSKRDWESLMPPPQKHIPNFPASRLKLCRLQKVEGLLAYLNNFKTTRSIWKQRWQEHMGNAFKIARVLLLASHSHALFPIFPLISSVMSHQTGESHSTQLVPHPTQGQWNCKLLLQPSDTSLINQRKLQNFLASSAILQGH